jgi:hypothetical protein
LMSPCSRAVVKAFHSSNTCRWSLPNMVSCTGIVHRYFPK